MNTDGQNGKKKVLVVDDEMDALEIIKKRLEADYKILEALSGSDGLKLAEAERPDIIILDIMMRGVSGLEVLDVLMHSPHLSRIPVIMVTALDDFNTQQEAGHLGARFYITKPLNGPLLQNKVKQLLAFAA
ncbi:MAG: response regulator [Candidatus Omnitrophica bacterium]|nr:response regulator [Candidatus Omnitrophota bacterium]